MSRSNPASTLQNPSTRWVSWNGELGQFEYFDKTRGEKGENVNLGNRLSFLLLDTLYSVRGWHNPSNSGIYSNEVWDTRKDPLVVKAFKGGVLAEGYYGDIKDRAKQCGGKFTANLYIAYKSSDNSLKIGAISLSGAALSVWMEFSKENRKALEEKAVTISGFEEKVNGRITYRIPAKIALSDVSEETQKEAINLDYELQEYLKAYAAKNRSEQSDASEVPDGYNQERNQQREEWNQAEETLKTEMAAGDTKLRELAQREPYVDDSDIPF